MDVNFSPLGFSKIAVAITLTLPTLIAHAQSGNEPTQFPSVTVTATATELDVRDAPASVSIISAEDIKKIPTNDLNEVLRRIPGLSQGTTTDGGTSIQIRGLPQRYTLVLIDGQRTGSSSDTFDRYSRNELNWIPVESIERIEVVRGPMSSLYGSDAMGGVINIITKKTGDKWGGSVTAGAIINPKSIRGNDYNGGFSISGPLAQGLKLRLNGQQTYQQADSGLPTTADGAFRWGGGREGSKVRSFGGHLDWDINQNHRLSLDYQRGQWRTLPAPEGDTSNPGGFTASSFTRGPSKVDRESIGLNYAGKHQFGKSKFSVNQIKYKNDTTAPLIRDGALVEKVPPDRRDPYVSYPSKAVAKDLIIDGSLSIPFQLGVSQLLTVGGQWQRSSLDNPNSVGSLPNADGVVGLSYKKVNSAALYGEDQLFLRDNLSLTLGLRADHHDDYGSNLSPRAYLVYHPSSDWTIRGGYSEGFRAPTLRESNPNYVSESLGAGCAGGYMGRGGCYTRGNKDLKPETTENWELGTSWEHNTWQAGITFFNTNFKDKIYERGLGYLGSRYWQEYTNVAKALTRGIEANFTVPWIQNSSTPGVQSLIWVTNITHMLKAENKETAEPLSAVSKWAANSTLDWQITNALNATLQAELIGKQIHLGWRKANNADRFGDQRIENSYVIYDLGLNYQISKQLRINAGIRNLFDRNPTGNIDNGNNFYIPGRRYFATLTASF